MQRRSQCGAGGGPYCEPTLPQPKPSSAQAILICTALIMPAREVYYHTRLGMEGLMRPGPQLDGNEETSGALRETRNLEKVTEARANQNATSSEVVP